MLARVHSCVSKAAAMAAFAGVLWAGGEQEECAVSRVETPLTIALEYGCHTIGGAIDTTVDLDSYAFAATAGDKVRILVDEISNSCLDPKIDVFGPGGFHETNQCSPFCDFRGVSCSFLHGIDIPLDGQYSIVVSDAGNDEVGSYTLQIEKIVPDQSLLALAYNTTQAFEIDPTTDHDYFTFVGLSGGLVRITVDETSNNCLDPLLEVIDPSGNSIASSSCSPFCDFRGVSCSLFVDVPLLESGRYTLILSDLGADEVGTGNISVTCILGCPPLSSVTTRNGSGTNAVCYRDTFAPTVGGTWCAEVDAVTNPGATLSGVFVCLQPLVAPQATPYGELLVDIATELRCSFVPIPAGGTIARHSARIPDAPGLVGLSFYTQAVTVGPRGVAPIRLCNAIDYVLGY